MSSGETPSYRIEFASPALKEFNALPSKEQGRVGRKIDALSADPRPRGVKKLKGRNERYRVRAGEYRVIYTIRDQVLVVLILRVGHRREIYQEE